MRIEKTAQYNYNNDKGIVNSNIQSQPLNKSLNIAPSNNLPSFGSKRSLFDFFKQFFGINDDDMDIYYRGSRREKTLRKERPGNYQRKDLEQKKTVKKTAARPAGIENPDKADVCSKLVNCKKPADCPKSEEVLQTPQVNRYSLVTEYDRLTKARAQLRKKTQGRELTPEEKSETERLRIEWGKVYKRLVPEHQSIVERKTAKDFATVEEKEHYIMNYVLPRMNKSEESALDALDMFEQFGFRADYPSKLDTTITKLTLGITTLPKECKSDKVLSRYIEVFGKYAEGIPTSHPDDEELAEAIANFATKGQHIKEETVLRGIELMKKIVCQNWVHERLDYALVSSYDAKFKNSEAVKNALLELKEVVKDMKYRLGADDR